MRSHAHTADRVVGAADNSENGRAVKLDQVRVLSGDNGDAVRRQILVIEAPAIFEIDEVLSGAVAACQQPAILGVDAGRGRIEVPLQGPARIVGRIDCRRRRRAAIDIGVLDDRPGADLPDHGLEIAAGHGWNGEEGEKVGRLVGRIALHGGSDEFAQPQWRHRREHGLERESRRCLREFPPGCQPQFLERPLRPLLIGQLHVIAELNDDSGPHTMGLPSGCG